MKDIDVLVFDLGGVLIDWNPEYLYSKIIPDEKERRWFLSTICTPEIYYSPRWKEMLGGPIHETVEIFRQLKFHTRLKLYALTNWSAETFPVALELYEFLHWFDGRLVSGEEKVRKPFPEIYRLLIDRFVIEPEKAIYVDDNIRNVLPARELGFHGIHFRTPALFKKELEGLGVL